MQTTNTINANSTDEPLPLDGIDKSQFKIGVASNQYNAADGTIEQDLSDIGNNIKETLEKGGYNVTFFDFNDPVKVINELNSSKPDIVFNVCERINNSAMLEPHPAAVMDILKVKFTGCSYSSLALCLDKIKSKKLLSYHNIPTPNWDYAISENYVMKEGLKFPLVVKPANQHNSIGIDNNSVVTNEQAFKERISYVLNNLDSMALIEEYIDGDEYDIPIIGNGRLMRVLPLTRTIYKFPEGMWNLYNYDSKWDHDSVSHTHVETQRPPEGVSHTLLDEIKQIAVDAYNLFDMADYARAEVKVDSKTNKPYLLEINPNPSINTGDSVTLSAYQVGHDYLSFLEAIMNNCLNRYAGKPQYAHLIGSTRIANKIY